MKNVSETYGVVQQGDTILAARVVNDGVRPMVTALQSTADGLDGESMNSGRLYFAVATGQAIIKRIDVTGHGNFDSDAIARFELAQSLLESQDQYYLETWPLPAYKNNKSYLAIAYHRREVDRLNELYGRTLRRPAGYKLDAFALAQGYNAFCRTDRGELQVLADIGEAGVTLAILYHGHIYRTGHLESAPGNCITPEIAGRLAMEFKLTISFDLARIFQDGITVPLSRIILAGKHARAEALHEALKKQFSAEIILPHFHEGYFQPPSATTDRYHPEQFLIPLGLAIE